MSPASTPSAATTGKSGGSTAPCDRERSYEVGGALRRTLFRSRVWRPSLVRAGLLGFVAAKDDGYIAEWTDQAGELHREHVKREAIAMKLVAHGQAGGMRFHDLRHSYASFRSGVHPKIVSTRLGHATVAFTLDTYSADIPDLDQQAAEDIGGLFLPAVTEDES